MRTPSAPKKYYCRSWRHALRRTRRKNSGVVPPTSQPVVLPTKKPPGAMPLYALRETSTSPCVVGANTSRRAREPVAWRASTRIVRARVRTQRTVYTSEALPEFPGVESRYAARASRVLNTCEVLNRHAVGGPAGGLRGASELQPRARTGAVGARDVAFRLHDAGQAESHAACWADEQRASAAALTRGAALRCRTSARRGGQDARSHKQQARRRYAAPEESSGCRHVANSVRLPAASPPALHRAAQPRHAAQRGGGATRAGCEWHRRALRASGSVVPARTARLPASVGRCGELEGEPACGTELQRAAGVIVEHFSSHLRLSCRQPQPRSVRRGCDSAQQRLCVAPPPVGWPMARRAALAHEKTRSQAAGGRATAEAAARGGGRTAARRGRGEPRLSRNNLPTLRWRRRSWRALPARSFPIP